MIEETLFELSSDDGELAEKLTRDSVVVLAERLQLKHTAIVQNILRFYNEELYFKQQEIARSAGGAGGAAAAVSSQSYKSFSSKEFEKIFRNSIDNLLNLQKMNTSPFIESRGETMALTDERSEIQSPIPTAAATPDK